jgi:hypothetical protein
MNAKDRAWDLLLKFLPTTRTYPENEAPVDNYEIAQECALLTVGEILSDYEAITLRDIIIQERIDFWIEVRLELELLTGKL